MRYISAMNKTSLHRQFRDRLNHLCAIQGFNRDAHFDLPRERSIVREVQELRDDVALLRRSLQGSSSEKAGPTYKFTRKTTMASSAASSTTATSSMPITASTSTSTSRFTGTSASMTYSSWRVPDFKPIVLPADSDSCIMTFGQYKNFTYEQIFNSYKGFSSWVVRTAAQATFCIWERLQRTIGTLRAVPVLQAHQDHRLRALRQ